MKKENLLSRAEMKKLMGGVNEPKQLTCWCSGGAGFSPRPGLSILEINDIAEEVCPGQNFSCS